MADLRSALLGGMAANLVPSGLVSLEDAMQDWRQAVMSAPPPPGMLEYHRGEAAVRGLCESIVRRAHLLSDDNGLNRAEVAAFLLTRSRQWLLAGKTIAFVVEKLPKTLGELGMLKIAEGGKDGEPLDIPTLKMALARPKIRTEQ